MEIKNIAIIGECMIELNGKPFGLMRQTFGGDTLNAAVYMSRSCEHSGVKAQVSYVSALGCDPISDEMVTLWQNEGINTDLVLRDKNNNTGLYLIQLDEHGERTFFYWRNQSAAKYLLRHAEFATIKENLKTTDMIFLSGISLAILDEDARNALLNYIAELKANGVTIAFDSNFRPKLWLDSHTLDEVRAIYARMFALTDIALVTFDDEREIWDDQNTGDILDRLNAHGIKKVVVKLGSDGCLAQDFASSSEATIVKTTPVAHVVDTTSAGDAFNGGFLAAYAAGLGLMECCKKANALAGIVIQYQGAIVPRSATNF
ncbi:sugar kinase [Aeromonas aquatilis]